MQKDQQPLAPGLVHGQSTEPQSASTVQLWLSTPGVLAPAAWLGFIALIWVLKVPAGLDTIVANPALFVLTALLAIFGMFFTEHPLSEHPRRTGAGKAGRKGRQIWVPLTVLPFLLVVALAPAWLAVGPEPWLHVGARWFAGISAAYLGVVAIHRAVSVMGVTLPQKYRSEGVNMPAAGQLAWRFRQAGRLLFVAARIRDRLEEAGHKAVLSLEAAGDRDLRVQIDAGELQLTMFKRVLLIAGPKGLNASMAARLMDTSSVADVLPGPDGHEVQLESSAGALQVIDRFLELRETAVNERGTLHDASANDLTFTCRARDPQGREVTWTSDGSQLVVIRATPVDEYGETETSEQRFDLQRSFRLLVSRSPTNARPMLQVLIRQSDGESGVAARWKEARLRVPLRQHDDELDGLPEEVMDAPVVLHPERFGQVWSGLYWCADGVGARPPRLPEVETGVQFVAAEELTAEPLPKYKSTGCLTALVNGFNILLVFALLIILGSSAVVWPVMEQTWRAWWVMLGVAGALLLLRHKSWWWGRPSTKWYLAAAEEELKRLVDGFVGRVVPVTVQRSTDLLSTRVFFSTGAPLDLECQTDEGIALHLRAWPAGLRPNGAAVAERLEIRGERGSGFADRVQQVIRVLERNDVPHSTRDDGSTLILILETRRILGGGCSAWHSLIGLVCDTLTPERVPSHIRRSLPDTVPVSPRLTTETLGAVVGKRWRGVKSAVATLGMAAVVLGFPVIHPEDYPLPSESRHNGNWGNSASLHGPTTVPDGALAAQCPEGETLYASLVELRCLFNAADGIWEMAPGQHIDAQRGLQPYRFRSPVVMRNGELRHSGVEDLTCAEFEGWIDELASERWRRYVEELQRRLEPAPAWTEYSYPSSQLRLDQEVMRDVANRCGVSPSRVGRARVLEQKYLDAFGGLGR